MKEYYVWYDHLLEELFAMEKIDLENNPQLKLQLETEKSSFNLVVAEDIRHAYEVYRESLPKIVLDNDDSANKENTNHDIPFSLNTSTNKKNYLH